MLGLTQGLAEAVVSLVSLSCFGKLNSPLCFYDPDEEVADGIFVRRVGQGEDVDAVCNKTKKTSTQKTPKENRHTQRHRHKKKSNSKESGGWAHGRGSAGRQRRIWAKRIRYENFLISRGSLPTSTSPFQPYHKKTLTDGIDWINKGWSLRTKATYSQDTRFLIDNWYYDNHIIIYSR